MDFIAGPKKPLLEAARGGWGKSNMNAGCGGRGEDRESLERVLRSVFGFDGVFLDGDCGGDAALRARV